MYIILSDTNIYILTKKRTDIHVLMNQYFLENKISFDIKKMGW